MARVNVLGLDGSLQNFGIAVASVDTDTWTLLSITNLILSKTEKSKDKKTKRADDDFQRFKQHCQIIEDTIEKYHKDWTTSYVFGEIPSGAQDARAAFAFGGVTAILAALDIRNKVVTVTPAEVKLAATGTKHADKEDVISAMYGCYPDAPWILSKRPNGMNIKTPTGEYLTNANEHLADSIGCILAGLKKLKEQEVICGKT